MKAITLRNIPPDLSQKIEQEAARTNTSLNATVIRLLQEAIGPTDGRSKKRDLSSFAGTWTKEEAEEFDRNIADVNRIDLEMWK